MTLLESLRQVPLFAGWDGESRECMRFLELGEEMRAGAGTRLVHEGDPAGFYILLEGELRVSKKIGGHEMVLATWTPGMFFGEVSLLLGAPFMASGDVLVDSRFFHLGPD